MRNLTRIKDPKIPIMTQDKGGKHLAHLDFDYTQGWNYVPGCLTEMLTWAM